MTADDTHPTDGTAIETTRIAAFLAVAFGGSWLVAAAIFALGWHRSSPEVLPGITLVTVLVAGGYMLMPALGHVVARTATGEGWTLRATLLRPRVTDSWPSLLAGWLLPVALTVLGAAVYFAAFPDRFGGLAAVAETLREAEETTGQAVPLSPAAFVAIQFVQWLLLAPLLNGLFAFGEEFGWRAYLLPKLLPLGERRALVVHGAVWGVWHWPLTAMGHNYGLGYAGAPWVGMAAMLLFSLAVGVVFGWLTLRSGSVWPAVVGHAVLNGGGQFPLLFLRGSPDLLVGPTPAGALGTVPWLALAAYLLWTRSSTVPRGPLAPDASAD